MTVINNLPSQNKIPNSSVDNNGIMSKEDKTKLDNIEEGANKYTHPKSHVASLITQDTTHRFVSDTEKALWNNKCNKPITNVYESEILPLDETFVLTSTISTVEELKTANRILLKIYVYDTENIIIGYSDIICTTTDIEKLTNITVVNKDKVIDTLSLKITGTIGELVLNLSSVTEKYISKIKYCIDIIE